LNWARAAAFACPWMRVSGGQRAELIEGRLLKLIEEGLSMPPTAIEWRFWSLEKLHGHKIYYLISPSMAHAALMNATRASEGGGCAGAACVVGRGGSDAMMDANSAVRLIIITNGVQQSWSNQTAPLAARMFLNPFTASQIACIWSALRRRQRRRRLQVIIYREAKRYNLSMVFEGSAHHNNLVQLKPRKASYFVKNRVRTTNQKKQTENSTQPPQHVNTITATPSQTSVIRKAFFSYICVQHPRWVTVVTVSWNHGVFHFQITTDFSFIFCERGGRCCGTRLLSFLSPPRWQ
jgi:hypothetical protein